MSLCLKMLCTVCSSQHNLKTSFDFLNHSGKCYIILDPDRRVQILIIYYICTVGSYQHRIEASLDFQIAAANIRIIPDPDRPIRTQILYIVGSSQHKL